MDLNEDDTQGIEVEPEGGGLFAGDDEDYLAHLLEKGRGEDVPDEDEETK